jgi:hypothetical protein
VGREEALVREAVSRIQTLRRRRKQRRKNPPPPRLALKFCGGCNPEIDRGLVARRIREELGGRVSWLPGDEEADFILIINGCRTACGDTAEARSGRPAVVLSGETVGE